MDEFDEIVKVNFSASDMLLVVDPLFLRARLDITLTPEQHRYLLENPNWFIQFSVEALPDNKEH